MIRPRGKNKTHQPTGKAKMSRRRRLAESLFDAPSDLPVRHSALPDDQYGDDDFYGDGYEDDEDDEDPEGDLPGYRGEDEDTPVNTSENSQLRVLAALIFANLSGTASVKETGDGELEVGMSQGAVFTVKINDGRITLGGAPNNPNVEQFIAHLDDTPDPTNDLIKAAEKLSDRIQETAQPDEVPPPVDFQGASGPLGQDDTQGDPNAPGGQPDQSGLMPAPGPDANSPDMGMGGAPDMGGMSPDMGGAPGMPPGGAPGAMGPQPPSGIPPTGATPFPPTGPLAQQGMPAASARRITQLIDSVANDAQRVGLRKIAARLDVVANTIEAKSKARNPWAICNSSLPKGTSDAKYERCVKQVKKKSKG
jgi:hypothetical protein